MNRTDRRLLGRIAPVTDDEAARLVSPDAFAGLAAQITATAPTPDRSTSSQAATWRRRKRVLLAVPAAAAAAAAGITVSVLTTSSRPLPAAASKALSFTVAHGYITVIVKNPYADPSWYNADFKAHHLNITLRMIPVSPSMVGTVPYTGASSSATESEVTMIYARCAEAPSGGHQCPVGIRVPYDFRGQYDVDFGRAARPGEKYVSTAASAFVTGEALHGMKFIVGQPLSTVLAEIGKRHLTAVLNDGNTFGPPGKFPGTWYVTDASPYAPGQVMLLVSRSRPPAG